MSTDLWPADVQAGNMLTPEEILAEQAEYLHDRTKGMLAAEITVRPHPDGKIITFDVVAQHLDSTVHLIEVYQQLSFDYPAAIVIPNENIPSFLKKTGQHAEFSKSISKHFEQLFGTSQETIIAATPKEFSEEIRMVLARPMVKGLVLSLIARSNKAISRNDDRS